MSRSYLVELRKLGDNNVTEKHYVEKKRMNERLACTALPSDDGNMIKRKYFEKE